MFPTLVFIEQIGTISIVTYYAHILWYIVHVARNNLLPGIDNELRAAEDFASRIIAYCNFINVMNQNFGINFIETNGIRCT